MSLSHRMSPEDISFDRATNKISKVSPKKIEEIDLKS